MKVILDRTTWIFRSVDESHVVTEDQELVDYDKLKKHIKDGLDAHGLYDKRNDNCRC
jgi:hypothetical protein